MNYVRNITLLIAFTCAIAVKAQEISFTATVDRNEIAVGERLKLTVALTNAREQFTSPDLGDLVVLQGPFESSSFNYVNGQLSSSVTRTWVLTATDPGTYTIGASRVRIGGGVLETDPITIKVTGAASAPSAPEVQEGQRRNRDLFVNISLSKERAFVGEQVIARYTLYSRYANLELSKFDPPKLNGFWAEEIDGGERGWEPAPVVVNGLQYRVAVLKEQVLFPQRAGKLTIGPVSLSFTVNRSFFSRGATVEISSNTAEFIAKELPSGAPPDFSGAVGELKMQVETDRTKVQADEAIELKVTLSGRSNLKLLDAPRLTFPADMEVYDPKTEDRITVNSNGMSGRREFQYLVIPRHEGEYVLDPITLSYFDPRSGKYHTLHSDTIRIEVEAGSGAGAGTTAVRGRQVEVLGRDIRYIRTGDLDLRPHGRMLFGSPRWIAAMAAPPLALLLFFVWYGKHKASLSDQAGLRRRKADRVARKRLSEAEKAMQQGRSEEFHTQLSKALHGYLTDKFGLGVAEITVNNLRERMSSINDGDRLAQEYTGLIAECDMARFAPIGDGPRRELYDKAVQLIGNIEREHRA